MSHLYGAWPADEITPDATPEIARGAWLAARKRAQGNESAHGMLHRSLAAARLKDPWLVTFDLKELLEQGVRESEHHHESQSLHDPVARPPGRHSVDPDGNARLLKSRRCGTSAGDSLLASLWEREGNHVPHARED